LWNLMEEETTLAGDKYQCEQAVAERLHAPPRRQRPASNPRPPA
jgi:hypothetical protein